MQRLADERGRQLGGQLGDPRGQAPADGALQLMPSSLRVAPTGSARLAWSRAHDPGDPPPEPRGAAALGLVLRGPVELRRPRRPGRDRRRPRAGDPAGGVPPGAVPDALGHARGTRCTGSARSVAGCSPSTAWWCRARCAARCATSRCASTRRSTRSWRRCADPARDVRLDRRRDPRGLPAAARAGLGALGGGLARRPARRRPVRRGDRRACSRGSRCSTRSGTPRRSRWSRWCAGWTTGTRRERLVDVQWSTPHLASLGVVEAAAGGVPAPAAGDPAAAARRRSSRAPRCGMSGRHGAGWTAAESPIPRSPDMKHALIAASLVLVAGTVAGCGGDTSSQDKVAKPSGPPTDAPRRRVLRHVQDHRPGRRQARQGRQGRRHRRGAEEGRHRARRGRHAEGAPARRPQGLRDHRQADQRPRPTTPRKADIGKIDDEPEQDRADAGGRLQRLRHQDLQALSDRGAARSDDARRGAGLADHRPAGLRPVEHPAVEVDRPRAPARRGSPRPARSGRRPGTRRGPARRARSASRCGSSISGMCVAPSMWPCATRRPRARRARAAPRAAGRGRRPRTRSGSVGLMRPSLGGRPAPQR